MEGDLRSMNCMHMWVLFFQLFFCFLGVEEEFFSFSFCFLLLLIIVVKKKVLEFHFLLEELKFLNIYIYIVPHKKYFLLLLVATKEKKVQNLLLVATKKKKKVCKLLVLIFVWLWCCYDYQTINPWMFIFWATHKQDKHVMKKIQLIKWKMWHGINFRLKCNDKLKLPSSLSRKTP